MTIQIHEDKYNRNKGALIFRGYLFTKSEQIMFSLILRGTSVGHCFTRFTLIFTLFHQNLKQPSNAVKQVPPPTPDYSEAYMPVFTVNYSK